MKPDYSEFLKNPGVLAWVEKEWLDKPETHEAHAKIINDTIKKYKLKSIIEVGCGTGEVAMRITAGDYIGVDVNEEVIKLAREKNKDKTFSVTDIRLAKITGNNLVFCFAFLKHFGLHEWTTIFQRIASFGEYFIFDMPIASETKDDGVEHHHVWLTKERIYLECENIGFEVVKEYPVNKDEICFIAKHK